MSKNDKISQHDFEQKVFLKYNGKIKVISNYVNNKTKVIIQEISTGKTKTIRPDNLLSKDLKTIYFDFKRKDLTYTEESLRKIVETKRLKNHKSIDEINNKLKEVGHSDLYYIVEEKTNYINNKKSTICLHCNRCDTDFLISFVNIAAGKGCNYCNRIKRNESKNVRLIKEFLNSMHINFELEYQIPECRNIKVLPFDFAINLKNKLYLIEYDGEFHDRGYNSNMDSLKKTIKNDMIKTSFCENNNIPLLRLRYNNFENYKEKIKTFLEV